MTEQPTITNVYQRLAQAMRAVSYIQKDEKPGMKYRVVSHDKVTAACRPALLDAGIVYYPVRCEHVTSGNRTECSITIRFVNIDAPSDFFDVQSFGFGIDSQDKGPGKAFSYAVKYALLKSLGLETGDDPDTDSETPSFDPRGDVPPFNAAACEARLRHEMAKLKTKQARAKFWENEKPAFGAIKDADPAAYAKLREDLGALVLIDDAAHQAPPQDGHVYG